MENYQVSARKYRPSRFEDVVGQEHITSTLINAIQSNQLAQAFLFCGPRGVGKTSCARILAKAINAENPAQAVVDGSYADSNIEVSLNIFELDAASNNSVEDIRQLIEQVRFAPQSGSYKVYIIDEVHMLSTQAFNAFLKTLEEPPPYAIFILATTEKHKILPTILSRCQVFNFKRIGVKDMAKHLKSICEIEKIEAEDEALHLISIKADGAMRDSLSIFDRMASFSNKKIEYQKVLDALNVLDYDYYFKITDALIVQDAPTGLTLLNKVLELGFDGGEFLNGLANHFRDLLFAKDEQTVAILEFGDIIKQKYLNQSTLLDNAFLLSALSIVNNYAIHYKTVQNKQLQVELCLLKIANINNVINLNKLGPSSIAVPEKKNDLSSEITPAKTVISKPNIPTTPNSSAEPDRIQSKPIEKPAEKPIYRDPLDPRNQQAVSEEINIKPKEKEKQFETNSVKELASEKIGSGISEVPETEDKSIDTEVSKLSVEEPAVPPTEKKADAVDDPTIEASPAVKKSLLFDMGDDDASPSLLSLKEIEEEVAEKAKEIGDRKRIEHTDISTEQIQKFWTVFKEGLDSNQSKAIFKQYLPQLNVSAIEVHVSNSVEQARVREEGAVFIDTFSKQFNLIDLDLKVLIDKSLEEETEKKLYTPQDKLQSIIDKNPAIDEFRKRLFLEIKY